MGCNCNDPKPKPNTLVPYTPPNVPDSLTLLNPLNRDTLVLDVINLSFDDNVELQNYIQNLSVPFIIHCILENKFIAIDNALTLVLEIPVSQTPNFSTIYQNVLTNIRSEGRILISIVQKESNIEPYAILSIVNTLDETAKGIMFQYVRKYISAKKKHNKSDSRKYKTAILDLFNKYRNRYVEKTVTFTVGEIGIKNIVKLKYFLTIRKFYRQDNICIDIPSYIQNWYQLQQFMAYIDANGLIKDKVNVSYPYLEDLSNNVVNITSPAYNRPVFYQEGNNKIILNNLTTALTYDFNKYLISIGQSGSLGPKLNS